MAAISPGIRIGTPRTSTSRSGTPRPLRFTRRGMRGGSPSPKQHSFESFSKRISKLKIDPAHTVEKVRPSRENQDGLQTFFHATLEEWAQLNLSTTFTSFFGQASPLSETLPLLLHHAPTIFNTLIEHIERRDEHALEPLLSLLAQLTHDLDHGFEPYFERAVQVVSQIAATIDKVEVVEWCFNCLAYMFKYLSKLLVQDLRPLLTVMIPYLSATKEYVVRFCAESLSFLLRKAAAQFVTDQDPLILVVQHLLGEYPPQDGAVALSSYQFGVMTLFMEAARGVDYEYLHSCSVPLVQCLLDCALPICHQAHIRSIVDGVLVGLINETNSETFGAVQAVILDTVRHCASSEEVNQLSFAFRLLLVLLGTQKGTRVSQWPSVIEAFQIAAAISLELEERTQFSPIFAIMVAMIIQYAPLDDMLKEKSALPRQLLEWVDEHLSAREFYAFATACAELGKERFVKFVLPELQKYISNHWSDDEVSLYYMLERLQQNRIGFSDSETARSFSCPPEFGNFILSQLSSKEHDEDAVTTEELAGRLRFSKVACLFGDSENTARSLDAFHNLLIRVLDDVGSDLDLHQRTVLGWGFDAFVEIAPADDPRLKDLASRVPNLSPVVFHLPACVQAMSRLFHKVGVPQGEDFQLFDNVRQILMRNLLSTTTCLKKASAQLLFALGGSRDESWLREIISLIFEILNTPYTPAEVRKIGHLLRRMLYWHRDKEGDFRFHNLVPYFCFGLMTHYHDKARAQVLHTLAHLIGTLRSEETIVNIAVEWLQSPPHSTQSCQKAPKVEKSTPSSFECGELAYVDSLYKSVSVDFQNSGERFRSMLEDEHRLENPNATPENGRSLALVVLNAMPASAEFRARSWIPIFLNVPFTRAQLQPQPGSDASASSHTVSPDLDDHEWSFQDRKAFLSLFGHFEKPAAVFKSSEVHAKLMTLLSNGNDEIRKLALKGILTWRDPVLRRYSSTMLLPLAEGKSDTSDIGKYLTSDGESLIRSMDRSTVLPVVLRLVFGVIVGRAGTAGSQDARRKSLLRLLLRLSEEEVSMFLDIALGRLREVKIQVGPPNLASLDQAYVPEDQRYGFLRLLLSMLETFERKFAPYGRHVVDAVVFCVAKASETPVRPTGTGELARSIRRTGFHCLVHLFTHCPTVDWPVYLRRLFADAISPRLDTFSSETTQISTLLRLFATWAKSADYVIYFGDYDRRVPEVTWQALAADSTPVHVKLFILNDIVLPWAHLADDERRSPNNARELLKTHSDGLFRAFAALLERTPARPVLSAITIVLPLLAPFAESTESRQSMVRLLTTLLSDDGLKIPPVIKGQLLASLKSFLGVGTTLDESSHLRLLTLTSSLFNFFLDQPNRQILCDVLEMLSVRDEGLSRIAQICSGLNATSSERLGEIDYDRRLQAFETIRNLSLYDSSSSYQPIIYNLLFFLRTGDDLAIRANALECLRQMIVKSREIEASDLIDVIVNCALPVTKQCIKHESEFIRADFVTLLGLLVQHARHHGDLMSMAPLLVGNDEEASFFSNILHVQQHRRLRAMQRLVSEVEKGGIGAANIVEIFIPLLTMFAHDSSSDQSAQSAKGQSVSAIGSLLKWIDWKQFKILFRRYKYDLDVVRVEKKVITRLLAGAADALVYANKHRSENSATSPDQPIPLLALTLPNRTDVEHEVRLQFIPKLAEFVHYKDEAEISWRLPVAVVGIKLITLLPLQEVADAACPIILDLAQILKSRSQDSRDAARKALCDIVLLLGAGSMSFVLRQMRTVLNRGYQLHVASYTLHAILVALVPKAGPGDMDYCCEELVYHITSEIFGAVGQEKDNPDYVSSMREVKTNKNYDSMQLLASSVSVPCASKLITPIQTILSGPLTIRQIGKVDELLRRIGTGITRNPSVLPRDVFTFSYQLIRSIHEQEVADRRQTPTNDEKNRERYLVQLTSADTTTPRHNSTTLLYKLAKLALELARGTFRTFPETVTGENVHGFLPILGDALVGGQEDVKLSAMLLLCVVIKVPLPELDQNSHLYVDEAVKTLRNSTSTNEEGAQAALKLIAAILRDRPTVEVKESDIAEVLHRVTPDIEAPDKQGPTFNFIRAVMGRNMQLPELYDLADKIGVLMVTSQSKQARDLARGVFVHFLLGYPQSSSRWSKHQAFLLTNLEYQHAEGRQSVMEAINTLTGKMKGEPLQELISAFFVPILLQMANDDNEGCRHLAGALLERLFTLAERGRLKDMFEILNSWIAGGDKAQMKRLGMQAYVVLLDTDVRLSEEEVGQIRSITAKSLEATKTTEVDEWELRFQALLLLLKLVQSHPVAELVGMLKASSRILRWTTDNEELTTQMQQILMLLGHFLDNNPITIEVNPEPKEAQAQEFEGSDFEEARSPQELKPQTAELEATAEEASSEEAESEDDVNAEASAASIPATQYLLDQLARNLRVETAPLTSAALLPKKSSLQLLTKLIPILSTSNLPSPQVNAILLPLQHMTDTKTIPPRSADPTFGETYQTLIELAHEVMEQLQQKLGDAEYVKAVTEVSKIIRERRETRRTKRRIEQVAAPEKAARHKKRKGDRKRDRSRELAAAHRKRRREQ
ncbi:hypothetical protein AYL99_09774 [Fonsecaea erecta]|uniref:Uncharacterized protein n=1 Tax=Fonsecaea erecta TaxID=1367422 RepID=A0A178Z7E2_9EURO|nr:hypothetical protein AYL99_09774 [Fonsecaea erecta]OAP55622.1 hypothetical protein AYL99_09774 [Fonsecaea erecta]